MNNTHINNNYGLVEFQFDLTATVTFINLFN